MPVYNERETIEEIIGRVLAVPIRIQLIVVDDGSKDGTRDILTALEQKHDFTLIFQERNQGKGAALQARLPGSGRRPGRHPGRRPRVLARGMSRS